MGLRGWTLSSSLGVRGCPCQLVLENASESPHQILPASSNNVAPYVFSRNPVLRVKVQGPSLRTDFMPLLTVDANSSSFLSSPNLLTCSRYSRKRRRRRKSLLDCVAEASSAAEFGDAVRSLDRDDQGVPEESSRSSTDHHTASNPSSSNGAIPGNGAATDRSNSRSQRWHANIVAALRAVRSVFFYGSWWEIGGVANEDKSAQKFWKSMRQVVALCSADRLILSLAFVSLIVAAVSELSIPHFVATTIFSASRGQSSQFYHNARLLMMMTFIYGVFSGLRGAFFSVSNQLLVRRIREKLYRTIISQDIAFFDKEPVGDLTSRLGSDCQMMSRIIGVDVNIMLRNALQGLGALAYLVTLSWQLALSTTAVCAVMWACMMRYGRFQRRAARVVQDTIASANEVAEETFSLARVVRTFGTEAHESARYSSWARRLNEINTRQSVAYGIWTWCSNTLYNATQVVALCIGGGFVMSGAITAEQLTKYILYAEWVVHATWWVGDHWAMLMEALGASEKVFSMLELPPARQLASEKSVQLANLQGHVVFENVSFQYPTRPTVNVLSRVNLKVQAGELVALVGLSGSGKSTLVGLLERLYDPSEGQIWIDGVPLEDLDVAWYRRQLGVVSQEPRLFTTDIASNIAYGSPRDVSLADIEWAARQANAHSFIAGLPDGYATEVGNARLSGGQKQRIAIARALVRRPRILILDEATSALDAESEHNVQVALDRAMRPEGGERTHTVFVIAHRLSTVRAADRIIVMKNGEIAEVGSHDELLERDGEYARLTKRQMSSLP